MALTNEQIAAKVDALTRRFVDRDRRMADITSIRRGNMSAVYPDMFPEEMSKPMIANFVDIAARDIAELLAPLPSFNCTTTNITSEKAKKFAAKKTMIVNNYVNFAKLETQMYTAADWYITYGFLPVFVEPDFEAGLPSIRVENPMGSYPEFNRFGKLVSFTKKYIKTVRELCIDFPEWESVIVGPMARDAQSYDTTLELMRYEDDDQIVLFLPQRSHLVLQRSKNILGRLSVRVARRPGLDIDDPRGQFDDVLWAQVARARFSLLALEAAEKSVQAPMVMPTDVTEFAFGPDSIIRTNNPAGVRRVGLELPPGAFQEQQMLENEMRMGSRYPEGRSGNIDASIITGNGVQALMGSFDSQIKAGQQILAELFQEVIAVCFEMDEKLFDFQKEMNGSYKGAPYELNYTPTKDIKGDFHVDVRYGLMAGLDPSRALIFSLQALNAGLISREFIMSELPWSINVTNEQARIDIEKMRDALSASLQSLTQAIPQMASQGQDPSDIVAKIASVINAKKKGLSIEDAVTEVFDQEAVESPTAPESPTEPTEAPVAPEVPPEAQNAPTAPTAPPGGAPDVASILSMLGGAG
jgi:hypothetical protein